MADDKERAHGAWRAAERIKRLSDRLVGVGPVGVPGGDADRTDGVGRPVVAPEVEVPPPVAPGDSDSITTLQQGVE